MRAVALWRHDLRSSLRDRTAAVLLVVPLLFVGFLRLGMPAAEGHLPAVADHRALVVGLACLLAGVFPAFMLSFIMLDERDEGLFPVFRVLPISTARFLFLRLVLVAALGFIYPVAILVGSGLLPVAPPIVVALAALCALQAPAAVLVILALARNKIEGLAVIKLIFPAVILPAAAFVVPGWWGKLLAVLPAYWVYAAFTGRDLASVAVSGAASVALLGALSVASYRRFRSAVLP